MNSNTEIYLDVLWSEENAEHPIDGWLAVAKEVGGKVAHSWYSLVDRDQLAARAEKLSTTSPTWVSCCCFRNKRRLQGNAAFVPGIFLDVDLAEVHRTNDGKPSKKDLPTREEAEAALAAMPVPPSFIVQSGGGLVPSWLFESPVEADPEVARLLKKWEQLLRDKLNGKHLDSVAEFARILRMPGLTNNKYGNVIALPDELQNCKPPQRYSLDELVELSDRPAEPAATNSPPATEPAAAAPEPDAEPVTAASNNPPDVSREDVLYALGRLGEHRRSAGSYDDWIKVGMSLHSFDDSESMLAEWWTWSRQAEDFADVEPEDLATHWESFSDEKDGGVTFRTLFAMANEDDPPRTFRLKPTTGKPKDAVSLKYDVGRGSSITLRAVRGDEVLHLDQINPHKATQRTAFCKALAKKLGAPELDLDDCEQQLLAIVAELEAPPVFDLAPRAPEPTELELTAPEILREASEFLEEPKLEAVVKGIQDELEVVGEDALITFVYLLSISRHFKEPLSLLVLGPTASGKSYVTSRVARCFAPESKLEITGASRFGLLYAPDDLSHKILIFGERSKAAPEEQADQTAMLRQLLSEHKISRKVTVRGEDGEFTTQDVEKEGPVAYLESSTSTPDEVFAEDLNRMIVVNSDESEEQTSRINLANAARWKSGDRVDTRQERFEVFHHTVARLVEAEVVRLREALGSKNIVEIPFAEDIAKELPRHNIEIRRIANSLYAAIAALALLNHRRRDRSLEGAVVAAIEDYEIVRDLMDTTLRRMLSPSTSASETEHAFFEMLKQNFGEAVFNTTDVIAKTGQAKTTVWRRLNSLVQLGWIAQREKARSQAPARWQCVKTEYVKAISLLPALPGWNTEHGPFDQQIH